MDTVDKIKRFHPGDRVRVTKGMGNDYLNNDHIALDIPPGSFGMVTSEPLGFSEAMGSPIYEVRVCLNKDDNFIQDFRISGNYLELASESMKYNGKRDK